MLQISEKQQNGISELAAKYNLRLLLLFGSQVSGKTHRESDIDIAYYANLPLSLMREAEVITELGELLASDKVDLVNLRRASPLLLFAVTDQAIVLFAKDELIFPTLRVFAFKQYLETRRLYQLRAARLKKEFLIVK